MKKKRKQRFINAVNESSIFSKLSPQPGSPVQKSPARMLPSFLPREDRRLCRRCRMAKSLSSIPTRISDRFHRRQSCRCLRRWAIGSEVQVGGGRLDVALAPGFRPAGQAGRIRANWQPRCRLNPKSPWRRRGRLRRETTRWGNSSRFVNSAECYE